MRGGIKNIKSSGVALIPAVQKGVTGAFKDALSNTGGIFFGKEGGYAEKSSKLIVWIAAYIWRNLKRILTYQCLEITLKPDWLIQESRSL